MRESCMSSSIGRGVVVAGCASLALLVGAAELRGQYLSAWLGTTASQEQVKRRSEALSKHSTTQEQLAFLREAASPATRAAHLERALEQVGPWAVNQSSKDNLIRARAPAHKSEGQ